MNRKTKAIVGIISLAVGLIIWMAALGEMADHPFYSFTPPYTQYEAGVILRKFLGIILVASGAVDLVMVAISRAHEDRNVRTPYDAEGIGLSTYSKCPKCGLKIGNTTKVCPKCRTNLKYINGRMSVDENNNMK